MGGRSKYWHRRSRAPASGAPAVVPAWRLKPPCSPRVPASPAGRASLTTPDDTCDTLTVAEACNGWRLPSEEEWEYLARAGGAYAPEAPPSEGFHAGNSGGQARESGEAGDVHPWGLVDTLGNVAEWTIDCYRPRLGLEAGRCDPATETSNLDRPVRGGGFTDATLSLSMRRPVPAALASAEGTDLQDGGFRLVRTPRDCGGTCSAAVTTRARIADPGLRLLAPPLVFRYGATKYPEIRSMGAVDTAVIIALNIGSGTPSDRLHLRLVDLNGESPKSDQPLKHDACVAAGESCATFVNRINPTVPLAEAPPCRFSTGP